ncbi:MAG: type II secretion system protein [Armatimonadota bacterium]
MKRCKNKGFIGLELIISIAIFVTAFSIVLYVINSSREQINQTTKAVIVQGDLRTAMRDIIKNTGNSTWKSLFPRGFIIMTAITAMPFSYSLHSRKTVRMILIRTAILKQLNSYYII